MERQFANRPVNLPIRLAGSFAAISKQFDTFALISGFAKSNF